MTVPDDTRTCGRAGGQVVVQDDTGHKLIYCFIPLLTAQLLLCAAAALLADMPAAGLLLGHILTAGMCMVLLREDGVRECRTAFRCGTFRERPGCIEPDGAPVGRPSKAVSGHITAAETSAWIAAAIAVCLISTYLLNISGIMDADKAYISADAVMEEAPGILRPVLVLIAAPISEEMLYRGVLYQRVTGCFDRKAGFLAAVAAFALSHGNLTQGIAACASGVLLTAARIRCRGEGERCGGSCEGGEQDDGRGSMGRLWLPVLIHAAFNACSEYVVPVLQA